MRGVPANSEKRLRFAANLLMPFDTFTRLVLCGRETIIREIRNRSQIIELEDF